MVKKLFLFIFAIAIALAYADEKKQIVDFIYDMVENQRFHNDDFLKEHCAEKVLKKLADHYDYICDGVCYAGWELRVGLNDFNSIKVGEVKDEGDGWYSYVVHEDQEKASFKIHAHVFSGKVVIFDYKKEYLKK